MEICPLCQNESKQFYKDEFFECVCCGGIFRPKEKLLDYEKEKQRYESHTNNSSDLGYQNFVLPITSSVLNEYKKDDIGLDFGCGKRVLGTKKISKHFYLYDPNEQLAFFFKKNIQKKFFSYLLLFNNLLISLTNWLYVGEKGWFVEFL